jgi:hypothetical protein
MRRVLLLAAGVLLTAAACGTAASPGPGSSGASGAAAVPVALKSTCDALGNVYGARMAPFAQSLTTMVGKRNAATQQQAQESLAAFAAAVGAATDASKDAALRTDGKKVAEQLKAKSADAKLFAGIRTEKDVTTTLGPTLQQWLAPVTRHCS